MAARRIVLEQSKRHRLRDGVRFCICSDRAVFLDLPADRYFCLPSAIDQDFRFWLADKKVAEAALDKLCALGVLIETESAVAAPEPAQLVPVLRDLTGAGRANLLWIFWAAFEQLWAKLRLRRTPFSSLVTALEISAERAGSSAMEQTRHAKVAAAFAGAGMLVHNHDNCLSQSLAFHSMCRRLGLDARFVIGVCLDPFSAHCWVQCGDLALNDSFERVQHFTPIMVA